VQVQVLIRGTIFSKKRTWPMTFLNCVLLLFICMVSFMTCFLLPVSAAWLAERKNASAALSLTWFFLFNHRQEKKIRGQSGKRYMLPTSSSQDE